MKKTKDEKRAEGVLWRILIFFVCGIILWIWAYAVFIVLLINLIVVLVSGKRSPELSKFCNYWGAEISRYIGYLTFESNEKPFPFSESLN